MEDLTEVHKHIILFDGHCNYCNGFVNKIIAADPGAKFVFAPLQSPAGKKYLTHLGLPENHIDSLVYIQPGQAYYIKSSAVLQIAKNLGIPYSLLSIFSFLTPSPGDLIYDYVAKNRYKWYGKTQHCQVPTEEIKQRFL